jgi:hypothetical protein
MLVRAYRTSPTRAGSRPHNAPVRRLQIGTHSPLAACCTEIGAALLAGGPDDRGDRGRQSAGIAWQLTVDPKQCRRWVMGGRRRDRGTSSARAAIGRTSLGRGPRTGPAAGSPRDHRVRTPSAGRESAPIPFAGQGAGAAPEIIASGLPELRGSGAGSMPPDSAARSTRPALASVTAVDSATGRLNR